MHCILCSSSRKTIGLFPAKDRMYGLPGTFKIEKCRKCGLWQSTPKLKTKEISKYYPSSSYYSYVENGKSVFSRLRKYLIYRFYFPTVFSKIIFTFINTVPAIPQLRPHGKIMDVGCGNGETLRSLKKYGWDVYGLDIDAKAVAYAKRKGLEHVKKGGFERLKIYPDNYFDVIRSYHVIEHLSDPVAFINLAYKKLKKGGECIIGTPNSNSVHANLFKSFWYNLDTPRHQFVFNPINLSRLVKKAGLSITDIQYCSGGGFLGSMQYFLSEIFHMKINVINNPFFFFLFYPFDLLSDKMRKGDVFVLTAKKK